MAAQIREQAGNEQFEGEGGHHDSTRVTVQFQGISGNGLDQFKDWARQVVVYPREYKAGNLIYPFEKAAQ
ncbi:MAG TPA: hypothetical protein VHT68_18345 [Pseudolabrys sp.]|jgi:branched-chain amino acid transport system substrate-binding protein|nr:hypothetical protein [Pseudolabrys sp.]